jgi:hypothetical protein
VTGRILGIELRRSTAPWVAAAFLAATLGLLYLLTGPWTHGTGAWTRQWEGLVQWQRALLMFTWPFVVGVGVWQGTRQRRSTMDELLSVTPRPAWRRVGVLTAAMSLTLTAAYLVPFAIGAVRVGGTTGYLTLSWLPTLLVGVLAVVAGAVLGMGIGHLLPYVATAPTVTVVAIALIVTGSLSSSGGDPTGSQGSRLALLSPALPGAATAYTTVAAQVQIGQFLLFFGLAVTGFALMAARGARARLLSALPAVLGIALALAVLPGRAAQAYPVLSAATAPVCDDNGPVVCVTAAHRTLLPAFVGPARAALAALAVLPNAPTSVREVPGHAPYVVVPLSPRSGSVLQVDLDDQVDGFWQGPDPQPDVLRRYLLAGAGTQPCIGYVVPYPDGDTAAVDDESDSRIITATWLSGDPQPPSKPLDTATDTQRIRSELATLRAQPRAEQVRRVAAARAIGLTCHGDPLDVLIHGVGAP